MSNKQQSNTWLETETKACVKCQTFPGDVHDKAWRTKNTDVKLHHAADDKASLTTYLVSANWRVQFCFFNLRAFDKLGRKKTKTRTPPFLSFISNVPATYTDIKLKLVYTVCMCNIYLYISHITPQMRKELFSQVGISTWGGVTSCKIIIMTEFDNKRRRMTCKKRQCNKTSFINQVFFTNIHDCSRGCVTLKREIKMERFAFILSRMLDVEGLFNNMSEGRKGRFQPDAFIREQIFQMGSLEIPHEIRHSRRQLSPASDRVSEVVRYIALK